MKSIFVLAYYSYKDPVFQSAVLPYLEMVSSPGLRFILLTWEQDGFPMGKEEKNEIEATLRSLNIVWHTTRWHSGKFKMIKKAFDFLKGLIFSLFLLKKYKAKTILSEGFPGAVIGYYLSKFTALPHIVHTFEPHADYMLEAGVWTKRSWEYKLLKILELRIANQARCIITATHVYKEALMARGAKNNISVIPSCIDTDHYRFFPHKRDEIRGRLGLKNDQIVIVYLGKLGGMYMDDEIFEFFRSCLNLQKEKFFFFLFINNDAGCVAKKLVDFDIPPDRVLVKYLDKDEVPAYLSAADIGFCGIRPIPSRRYSSPIKNGEYWACGLPVLIPEGVSDDYTYSREKDMGFSFKVVEEIDLSVLESLRALDRSVIQQKCFLLRGLRNFRQPISDLFIK